MRPIARRQALQLGGLGLVSIAVGGTGLALSGRSLDPLTGVEMMEPETLRSVGGGLRVDLEANAGPVRIAGRKATAYGYNGGVPGPTLRLRPGDRLQVRLINRLDVPTNLHVHGLHVSPEGSSDNVFITVEPGDSFDYDYQLPDDHPLGVFWYHPHRHGKVADHVFGGLYGAIVVEDPDELPVTRDRVLVVSDISLDATGRLQQPSFMEQMSGREGELLLLNGQVRPRLTARPGGRERWRFVNACASRYLRLRLQEQQVDLLGIDGGRHARPHRVEEVVLATGNRADLLVTTAAGTSTLEALAVDRGGGMMGGMAGGFAAGGVASVATFEVSGDEMPALPPLPRAQEPRDLRGAEVTTRRQLTFHMEMGMDGGMRGRMGPGGMRFTIDGREFNPERVDQTVALGTVEEWTISNTSPMDHPMHLHVWPMQVVAEDGRPVDGVEWRDVVNIPALSEVTVRIAFERFAGRTVYHCHILDHEDLGMMGVVVAR